MNGKLTLYLDQYGNRWLARTVRDLRDQIGGGRVSRMFRDKADGSSVHVGYVVGAHWCDAFQPVEIAA